MNVQVCSLYSLMYEAFRDCCDFDPECCGTVLPCMSRDSDHWACANFGCPHWVCAWRIMTTSKRTGITTSWSVPSTIWSMHLTLRTRTLVWVPFAKCVATSYALSVLAAPACGGFHIGHVSHVATQPMNACTAPIALASVHGAAIDRKS